MAIKFGRPLEKSRLAPVETTKADRLDLPIRPRRNRRAEWARRRAEPVAILAPGASA